eukprot:CAMPEP_0114520390 /NCGR_PEP_ID=MMETSP0109-20121206/19550_1 /TAXON_ID=29199 /ORGANISM="Chlorarachnion reptans, Strain CCCM449" /LENGTH=502 /DNA_ID=CAMNT_0001701271 /DNA_START=166 /DNA_END=1674 /DNA_ORIENTATION=-
MMPESIDVHDEDPPSDTDSDLSDDEAPMRRKAVEEPSQGKEEPADNVPLAEDNKRDNAAIDEPVENEDVDNEDVDNEDVDNEEGNETDADGEDVEREGSANEDNDEDNDDAPEVEEKVKDPDPWDVPRAGKFYLHDDRFDKNTRGRGGRYRKRGGKQLWEADEPLWTHDKFEELEREPEDTEMEISEVDTGKVEAEVEDEDEVVVDDLEGAVADTEDVVAVDSERGGRPKWVKKEENENSRKVNGHKSQTPNGVKHGQQFHNGNETPSTQQPASREAKGSTDTTRAPPRFSAQDNKSRTPNGKSQGRMNPKAKGFIPAPRKEGTRLTPPLQQSPIPTPQGGQAFYPNQQIVQAQVPVPNQPMQPNPHVAPNHVQSDQHQHIQPNQHIVQPNPMQPPIPAQYFNSPQNEEQLVYGYQIPQGFIPVQHDPSQVEQAQGQYPQNVQYVYEVPGFGYVSGGSLDPALVMQQQLANVQISHQQRVPPPMQQQQHQSPQPANQEHVSN